MAAFVPLIIKGALIGAGVGGTVAIAKGGDPVKGAKRGATAGAITGPAGAVVGPSTAGVPEGFKHATAAAAATGATIGGVAGGVAGGATVKKMGVGKFATAMSQDPVAKTVLAGERAESVADKLKKRKRYRTAMSGYGDLNLGKAGLLGV